MMLLPRIAFVVLILIGIWQGELSIKRALVFVGIWVLAVVGFALLGLSGFLLVPVEVVLDITLILMIFGGDIRIR